MYTQVLLLDAGSAEVFCTILHWCFPSLFPENRCEITLTGKRQGSRNYRDRIIGMAKHILSGLYFFVLYIGTDRNSHLFCEQVTEITGRYAGMSGERRDSDTIM